MKENNKRRFWKNNNTNGHIEIFFKKLRKNKFDDKQFKLMLKLYGPKFYKSLKAVMNKKIKKYIFKPSEKIIWIVIGKKCEYIVLPERNFCLCDDFYYRTTSEQSYFCYHIIACYIAKAIRKFDVIVENDKLYNFLLNDWKKQVI